MIFSSTNDGDDPESWSYGMTLEENSEWLVKEYTFWEMNPRCAVVCPRGFFLSTIIYHFLKPGQEEKKKGKKTKTKNANADGDVDVMDGTSNVLKMSDLVSYMESIGSSKTPEVKDVGDPKKGALKWNASSQSSSQSPSDPEFDLEHALYNLDHLMAELDPTYQEEVQVKKKKKGESLADDSSNMADYVTATNHRYGTCSTLIHCLGHQACLFHLSSDLCHNDPLPGFRKVLNMQIKCEKDSKLEEILQGVSPRDTRDPRDAHLLEGLNANLDSVLFIPPNKEEISTQTGGGGGRDGDGPDEEDGEYSQQSHTKTYETEESDVFGVVCPTSEQAKSSG